MTPNLLGSLWMVAAMAGFAIEDMFLKSVARELPVGQILMIFGAGGMTGFALLAARRGEAVLHPAILTPVLLIRCIFEVAGRLFYTLAIAFTPLSSASAILQATPLVVVMGAALIFGERVGWRRWTAILAGFAGCSSSCARGWRDSRPLVAWPWRERWALPDATLPRARPRPCCRTCNWASTGLQ